RRACSAALNGVASHASRICSASPGPTTFAPRTSTFASLLPRAISACHTDGHETARIPVSLLHAIVSPEPPPPTTIARSASPPRTRPPAGPAGGGLAAGPPPAGPAAVVPLMPAGLEPGRQTPLQKDAVVVGCDRDPHLGLMVSPRCYRPSG